MNFIKVSEGDVIDIPSGMVCAMEEGIVLADIQQSSNVTYRVYAYDRVDKDGNKRELYISKSVGIIDFNNSVVVKTEYLK